MSQKLAEQSKKHQGDIIIEMWKKTKEVLF